MIRFDEADMAYADAWMLVTPNARKSSGVTYTSRAAAREVARSMKMGHRVVQVRIIYAMRRP